MAARRSVLPQSDLDAKVSPEEASRLKREVMVQMLNAKADWIERTMRLVLPPALHAMVHDESGSLSDIEHRREIVRKYLDSQDVRMEEKGLFARFVRGRRNGKPEQIGQAFAVHLAEE